MGNLFIPCILTLCPKINLYVNNEYSLAIISEMRHDYLNGWFVYNDKSLSFLHPSINVNFIDLIQKHDLFPDIFLSIV